MTTTATHTIPINSMVAFRNNNNARGYPLTGTVESHDEHGTYTVKGFGIAGPGSETSVHGVPADALRVLDVFDPLEHLEHTDDGWIYPASYRGQVSANKYEAAIAKAYGVHGGARAAKIVRAVNSHAELLAACKAAQNWLREYIGQNGCADDPLQEGEVRLHNDLLAAIKKAEAQQ
jgi:hypothetical protein